MLVTSASNQLQFNYLQLFKLDTVIFCEYHRTNSQQLHAKVYDKFLTLHSQYQQ